MIVVVNNVLESLRFAQVVSLQLKTLNISITVRATVHVLLVLLQVVLIVLFVMQLLFVLLVR